MRIGYWWESQRERQRSRWVDNIKMDLLEIGLGGVDLIGLDQDRGKWRALVNVVMNIRGTCWETIEWLHNGGLSSNAQSHLVSYPA
jgi:hypothetical protein